MNLFNKTQPINEPNSESYHEQVHPTLLEMVSANFRKKPLNFEEKPSVNNVNEVEKNQKNQIDIKQLSKSIRENNTDRIFLSRRAVLKPNNKVRETKQEYSIENYIECQISIKDDNRYLKNPIVKNVCILPNELDDLILFFEQIEKRRKTKEKEMEEKKSAQLAKKIVSKKGGAEFLSTNSIVSDDNGESWHKVISLEMSGREEEIIAQVLNFHNPQHSWILETWLSEQATSWVVKRQISNRNQIMFHISYGFADNTSLEAESPSREGAILAIAEDLLG